MQLSPGTRLGAYEITGALGAGGMGEVYRARDTRLGRDVALKIIYVRPFPDVDAGKWQVSERGGSRPFWARSGRELFYLASDGWLMSVPVETKGTFSFGNPARAFNLGGVIGGVAGRPYDMSADGTRVLVVKPEAQTSRAEIHVVLNWFEELKRRVPIE